MKRAVVFVLLAGCVSGNSKRSMGGLSMQLGSGRVSDSSPDEAQDTPSAIGGHLCALYRLYPSFALGIGLDSTTLRDENRDDDELEYNAYGGAITGRLDLGRFQLSTTAAYYIGERKIEDDSIFGRDLSISGPGVGAILAARIGVTNGVAIEVGPFIRFFYMRASDDEESTMDYDERDLRLKNLAFGVSFGVMLGGPPVSGVEPSF